MKKALNQFGMDEEFNRKTTIVEEFLDIDASLIELEQNKDLIRMEMNIIEFPIFSRSRKLKVDQIKKYYFATDKSSYLEVVPGNKKTIPGEFEERVFIALLKIFKSKGYQQSFYCTASEIIDNLNIENYNTRASFYSRIRESVSKLATTNFKFKNLFYSSELKKPIGELIETNILTYMLVTLNDSKEDEKELFEDKRVKEVYKIMLAGHFYENIVQKGYLAFDSDELLSIKDSVTRSIYTMITKWRNNELYLRRPAFYIARRVPLTWKKETVRKTIPRIEESFKELKEYGYISDYNVIKNGKLDKTEFEIFFSEEHNKIKREVFYDEKSEFNKMVHYEEERQNEAIESSKNSLTQMEDAKYSKILGIFGEKGEKLKTLPSAIKEALKLYDFDYVAHTAEYTMFNCKISFIKYFKDALINRWADEYIAKKEIKLEKKEKKEKNVIEEAILVEESKEKEILVTWDEYLSLDSVLQEELYEAAYEEFLIKTGSKDNKIAKGIFDKSKKSHILKVFSDYEPKNKEILEIKEEIQIKKTLEKPKELNVTKLTETYASSTHFILAVTKFAKENNIEINLMEVAPIFKLFNEYEDFNIKFIYNETTNIGEIIKKI